MNTVKEIHMGEQFKDASDHEDYTFLGSTSWGVWNSDGELIEVYSAKYIAEYEANLLNENK